MFNFQELQNHGTIDEIFGSVNETYMTMNQLSALASEIFFKLNISHSYKIEENVFRNNFIEEMQQKTSVNGSSKEYEAFQPALIKISKFKSSNLEHTAHLVGNILKVGEVCKTIQEYININRTTLKLFKNIKSDVSFLLNSEILNFVRMNSRL